MLREFESHLLLAIGDLGEDAYGLAIHERVEALTGRSVAIGQIYTGLARLEQRGLVKGVEGETAEGRGGRPRKFYQLHEAALAELRSSAETYRQLARQIRSSLPRMRGTR
jgi:PadR family transcriptional regulator PadR